MVWLGVLGLLLVAPGRRLTAFRRLQLSVLNQEILNRLADQRCLRDACLPGELIQERQAVGVQVHRLLNAVSGHTW